ncbi:hypothetical protein AAHA92_13604 [Salvia divinorum]|uniref:Uncharacterized protein n=1 Tax=Salvia divinorum TaxID=28513 RepID=A0ABD1H9E5_SALDI
MDDDKKGSCRKPPLPVDRLRRHATTINSLVRGLLWKIDDVYKVKGKWCHKFTKNLVQLVLTKLQSKSRKKPNNHFNSSSLHCIARSFALVVKCVLKVGGEWSNDYNDDLIQLALTMLRSSSAPSINNNNNPLAVDVDVVGTANELSK